MIHPSQFQAPWWARSPHLQTIMAKYLQPKQVEYRTERFELPDGDFVDLAWAFPEHDAPRPLVVLFHGLEGEVHSHYIQGMMATLQQQGWQALLMHFRGCSGEPNRHLSAYHSGAIDDPHYLLAELRQRYPHRPLAAIGYSLGGNILVNYLAKYPRNPLASAVIVSAPLQLSACAEQMNRGVSRIYQRYLLKKMQLNWQRKQQRHPQHSWPGAIENLRSIREFDDKITAPVHGFMDAEDYYHRCSGLYQLANILTPTLILHAADDPFMSDAVIPDASDLPPAITYELSQHGGHVGFIQGSPWRPHYWLEQRIPAWLATQWPPPKEQA